MDFLLKRLPAFSRALGEWESDSEEEQPDDDDLVSFSYISSTGDTFSFSLNQLFSIKPVKKVIIAVGPLATAFVHCIISLSDDDTLCKIAFRVPDYSGAKRKIDCTSSISHQKDDQNSVSLVLTFPQTREMIDVAQRVVVEQVMNDIFSVSSSTDIDVAIFCSSSVHNFQTLTTPVNVPFLRHLYTSNWTHLPDGSLLEPPNLITGFAAEFFTWCEVHAIKARLTVVYHSTNEVPDYAKESVREVMNCLLEGVVKPCNSTGDAFSAVTDNRKTTDHNPSLREACISTMCGRKPSKMDQMYT